MRMKEGSGEHVLIVEDNALVVGAIRLLLEESGFQVRAAGSVAEAVPLARDFRPDVMLLDLSLPDGDGLVVLERLTSIAAAPRVTVALTGHDDVGTRDRCLNAGCRAVLIKPMSPLALPHQLSVWLSEINEPRSGSATPPA
ncbi:MAG TPA: response regulator [Gemmatimonadaceae bacterium]|nr:response regulator [Gemmatimonadaceae bacterium]